MPPQGPSPALFFDTIQPPFSVPKRSAPESNWICSRWSPWGITRRPNWPISVRRRRAAFEFWRTRSRSSAFCTSRATATS